MYYLTGRWQRWSLLLHRRRWLSARRIPTASRRTTTTTWQLPAVSAAAAATGTAFFFVAATGVGLAVVHHSCHCYQHYCCRSCYHCPTAKVSTSRPRPSRCAGCWPGHRCRRHRFSGAWRWPRTTAAAAWPRTRTLRTRCARATAAAGRCGRSTWPARSWVAAWSSWRCSAGRRPRPWPTRSAAWATRPGHHALVTRSASGSLSRTSDAVAGAAATTACWAWLATDADYNRPRPARGNCCWPTTTAVALSWKPPPMTPQTRRSSLPTPMSRVHRPRTVKTDEACATCGEVDGEDGGGVTLRTVLPTSVVVSMTSARRRQTTKLTPPRRRHRDDEVGAAAGDNGDGAGRCPLSKPAKVIANAGPSWWCRSTCGHSPTCPDLVTVQGLWTPTKNL